MNTKKKHKNRPKPTPTQPPKVESVVQEEKVEDVPKSDVKGEILTVTAEKISMTTAAAKSVEVPVASCAETGSDTPKKPKRKGKKKNQDKENVEEDLQEKVEETIQSVVLEAGKVSVEEENKSQDDNKSMEAAQVTPSARKKKNKKKSQEGKEQSVEQQNVSEKGLPLAADENELKIQKVDTEIKATSEVTKPETKSKKKNKKKKRTDSERSDKSEEVTCTSAFQQLLIEDEKPLEKTEIKIKDQSKEDVSISIATSENVVLENVPKNWDTDISEEIKESRKIEDDNENVKEEVKNNKKNKKDKKSVPEEQKVEQVPEPKIKLTEIKSVMDLIEPFKTHGRERSPKPTSEATLEVKQEMPESLTQCEKEPSPKPKAKIAKPVEKKRKDQQDIPVIESCSKSIENLSVKEEVLIQERPQTPLETILALEEKLKEVEPIVEPIDTIHVTESKTKDKKRKKSPKPQKTGEKNQVKQEPLHDTAQPTIKHELLEEKLTKSSTSGDSVENVMVTMSDEPFIPLQKSERMDEVPPLVKIDETTIIFDNKTGKKKKKTPKLPVEPEPIQAKQIKQLVTPDATETKEIPKAETPLETERVSESLAAPLSDIEIRSVKTDDSGSSCDATPDVHFVRSSSHQRLDDNNNMLIHEIRNVEEIKANEPIFMPIVEGSGETPSRTPDLVSSSIQMTESAKTRKEEPTFLKSKMMEVNQDMEELRLSIERSLAEFSAMEKSEEKAEKDYEPHRLECEKTFAEVEVTKPEAKVTTSEVDISLPVDQEKKATESVNIAEVAPVCPARKDNKGRSKSKKKGKQEATPVASTTSTQSVSTTTASDTKDKQEKQDKTEHKTESDNKDNKKIESEKKGKQQSDTIGKETNIETQEPLETEIYEDSNKQSLSEQTFSDSLEQLDFAPIDNFEDALTSSLDDVNKSFEMIVSENAEESQRALAANKPEINITAPTEDNESNKKDKNKKDAKVNPVSQPKNFLGHSDIPAQSNKTDYKKEKNKTPNERQAKVKIKDSMDVEVMKESKESQTIIKITKKQDKSEKESFSRVKNDNEEYVYKYSFRKVFLQSACHICHKDLQVRVPCSYCNLVFYCGAKHKDEDWTQHQALCFAVSTIAHLKDQKHIYADAQNITGQEYRLLRMQMIVSCEKVLKRRLVPWEQEAMLYPRMCGDVACREWRQTKLKDCDGCGQISYCTDQPSHLPKTHQRWCKSYHLYSKLVGYQQTRGRLEPRLPTKVMDNYQLAEKMNEVLAAMYEEKIDMNDIQYAALTQLATAPLTAAHCYQLCKNKINYSNGIHKKTSFTIHVVGAELQFEADALNKWEVFFLHLRPDVEELRVVLISPALNPGDLPLDLLRKIRLCDNCRQQKRRVVFSFQDKKNYFEYRSSEEFVSPDIVCAFNPSIQRSSVYNGKDPWPNTINCVIKQRVPFVVTGYTLTELRKDIARIKECSEADFRVVSEPVFNNFASVRPDRNFISDDEMPLLFKNYCVSVLCGC